MDYSDIGIMLKYRGQIKGREEKEQDTTVV